MKRLVPRLVALVCALALCLCLFSGCAVVDEAAVSQDTMTSAARWGACAAGAVLAFIVIYMRRKNGRRK